MKMHIMTIWGERLKDEIEIFDTDSACIILNIDEGMITPDNTIELLEALDLFEFVEEEEVLNLLKESAVI